MIIEKAVKHSIENIYKEGLTDIFPRPFEVDLLTNTEFVKKVDDLVLKSLKGKSFDSLAINRISHVLMPKNSAFDFRRCALIQPLDTIKYTALVLMLAETIEKHRIPVSDKRIFSYRLKINKGYLFNKYYTITSFISKTREKARRKGTKFVVSCDIANFYDRLNLHRLENQLLSIGCDKTHVAVLNETLLFWSNRDSYGLPVGSNASRILAEASLIGVDNYLLEMEVDFIRFVDDYRLFAPDANTAHYWLTILIERLWHEGLTINKSKTKIEAAIEFKRGDNKQTTKVIKEEAVGAEISKDVNPFRIRAGYGGTVPTKYRKMSIKEENHFKTIDLREKIKKLAENDFIEAEQIVEIVKIIISQKEYTQSIAVVKALDKYPQLTPYLVDALIKHSDYIDENTRDGIKKYFGGILNSGRSVPEYLTLAVIRLYGDEAFVDKSILMKMNRALRRNSGVFIGRALLESLEKHATRDEANEVRNNFDRSDAWEKRQIVKIVQKSLHFEEQRPWFKNIRTVETNDIFLTEIVNPSKKTQPKKKKK